MYALVACTVRDDCPKHHGVIAVPTSRRASKGSPTRMGAGPGGPSALSETSDNADRDGAAGVSREGETRLPPGQGLASLPEPVATSVVCSPGSPADGAAVRARVVGRATPTGLGDPTTQARVPA